MGQMSEAELKKELAAGAPAELYCICGTEKLLVSHYTSRLVEKTAGARPDEFNLHTFTNDFDVDEFAAALQMVPFTGERGVVLVKDLNFADFSSSDGDKILKLTESVQGTTLIYSYPTSGDAKLLAKDKKLRDICKKRGVFVQLNKLGEKALQKKLVSWASKRGTVLSPELAQLMVEYSGTDMTALRNELEKVCAYVGEGEASKKDIDALVTRNLESSVFDLSKAVVAHDSKKAFAVLDTLFYQREEPISILAVLSNAYVDMYRVRVAVKCGHSAEELSAWFPAYKGKEFRLRHAERDCRRTSTAVLRKSIDAIARTDIEMKSTRGDKRVQLELLIVKLLILANEDTTGV